MRILHLPAYTIASLPRYTISTPPGGMHNLRREGINLNYASIGDRIRKLRSGKGITQEQLAAALNLAGPWKICRIERGAKGSGVDRLGTLEAIARYFGVSVCELIEENTGAEEGK